MTQHLTMERRGKPLLSQPHVTRQAKESPQPGRLMSVGNAQKSVALYGELPIGSGGPATNPEA